MRLTIVISLLVLTACQPGLYVPQSQNVPLVNDSLNHELKLGISINKIEVQYNHLNTNNWIQQAQLSQLWFHSGRSRIELGLGRQYELSNQEKLYWILGLGYSRNIIRSEWDGFWLEDLGYVFSDWSPTQYDMKIPLQASMYGQFGFMNELAGKLEGYSLNLKTLLQYSAPSSMSFTSFGWDTRHTTKSSYRAIANGLMDLNFTGYGKHHQISTGMKIPIFAKHSPYRSYYTQEYFYLRLAYRFNR